MAIQATNWLLQGITGNPNTAESWLHLPLSQQLLLEAFFSLLWFSRTVISPTSAPGQVLPSSQLRKLMCWYYMAFSNSAISYQAEIEIGGFENWFITLTMRLTFSDISNRTTLWQGQAHWEQMWFSHCGVREGREICVKDTWISTANQGYHQVNITNRNGYSSVVPSSQSRAASGALFWHTCLPDPPQAWGSNPQAGEFPASQTRRCLVWEHCAPVKVELQCNTEHVRHLWGETREEEEASFWDSWLQWSVEKRGTCVQNY